jgi:predicted dehydrogenase
MDPFADRLENLKGMFQDHNPRTFQGVEAHGDLIESGVDGVVVTSPPYYHPQQVAATVEAGKHVYMAKPVAVDVTGCLSIVESCKKAAKKNLNFLVDFQTRVTPFFIEAAKRVREGAIGKLVCGQIFYQTGRLDPKHKPGETKDQARLRNWVFDKVLSGDIIVEQNVHVLDVSNWYIGTHPVKAYGTGGREARTDVGDCWDHFIIIYWYPNNVKIDFSSSQFLKGFHDMCMRVYGTAGTVDSHYGGVVKITGDNPYEGGETESIYRDGSVANVKQFVENLKSGKVFNNGEVSAESTLTAVLGRMAAYSGREVTWDEMMKSNERLEVKLKL